MRRGAGRGALAGALEVRVRVRESSHLGRAEVRAMTAFALVAARRLLAAGRQPLAGLQEI